MSLSSLINVLFKHLRAWHLKSRAGARRMEASMQRSTAIRPLTASTSPFFPSWHASTMSQLTSQTWETSGVSDTGHNDLEPRRKAERMHFISGYSLEPLTWYLKLALLKGQKRFFFFLLTRANRLHTALDSYSESMPLLQCQLFFAACFLVN